VGLNDTVQELAANETEFAVNGCGCTAGVVPAGGSVVRKAGIGVLEEGDSNYAIVSMQNPKLTGAKHLPSQWLTHRYGRMYHTSRFAMP
jgi:hypothetical protein